MQISKKKAFIINTIYFIMIVVIGYLIFKYAIGLFFPLVLGLFFATILQSPLAFLTQHTKIPKKIVAVFLILILFSLLSLLIWFVGFKLFNELKGLVSYLANILQNFPDFIDNLNSKLIDGFAFLPDDLKKSFALTTSSFFENMKDFKFADVKPETFVTPITSIVNFAKQLPDIFITSLMTIVITIFLTMDYRLVATFIHAQLSPKKSQLLTDCKKTFFTTIWKMFRAYIIIMSITSFELFIGLSILKIEYALVLSLIICIVDILPVLGTGTVLIPWAVYEFIMGNPKLALGLVAMYAIITIVRNLIEPKIVGHSVGLHPIVTLTSMFFGLKVFGFLGMFCMPIIIITLKVLQDKGNIRIWKSFPTQNSEEISVEPEKISKE